MAKCEAGEQQALWNGSGGRSWVDAQEVLDGLFRPFEEVLVEAVRATGAMRVLDVGCGTGGVTVAVARRIGVEARSVGIDISEPMIAAARARAEKEASAASFIVGDAQEYAFEAASFDLIVSRFGVMFFADPVRAFANLRRAVRERGELRLAVWRSAAENQFMTAAECAAAPFLPNLPVRRPDAPGQFGFADPQRVRGILEESGWGAIEIEPLDVVCTMSAEELALYASRMGPVGAALEEADDRTREQVVKAAMAAFAPFVYGERVEFTAACWMVSATTTQ